MLNNLDFKRIFEDSKNRALYEILKEAKIQDSKKKIEQGLQGMRPGQAMMAISKQLDMSSTEFLKKNLLKIIIAAAKAGKVKATALKDAIKDFGDKNVEDKTGIDWNKLKIDSSTMTYKCLFDGDSKKKLQDFIDTYSKELENVQKEAEADNKKLQDEVKKTGLNISDEEVNDNGIIVANSVAKKGKKTKKEIAKDIEQKIKLKKQLEDNLKKSKKQLNKLKAAGIKPKAPNTKKKAKNESISLNEKSTVFYDDNLSDFNIDDIAGGDIYEKIDSKGEVIWLPGEIANKILSKWQKHVGNIEFVKNGYPTFIGGNSHIFELDDVKITSVEPIIGGEKFYKALEYARNNPDVAGNIDDIIDKYKHSIPDEYREAAEKAIKKSVIDIANTALDTANDTVSSALDSETSVKNAEKTIKKAANTALDKADNAINNKLDNLENDISDAAAKNAIDSDGRVFNYMSMDKQFDKLEDVFADGRITQDELKLYTNYAQQISEYQIWAAENADSTNPEIKQRCAAIMAISKKFNEWELDNYEQLQELSEDSGFDVGKIPPEGKKIAAKASTDQSMKEASKGFLGKAFSALGIARVAAKTTGIILNNGKAVVDILGAYAIKRKEDKGIIAELKFILSNGKDSDTNFDDTKFSVRYDINDGKWHATCLDNRKLKFPEEEVIKKVLSTKEGKKFKSFCLNRWKSIFRPKDKKAAILTFILKNFESIGLKADNNTKELTDTLSKFDEKFGDIEKSFSSKTNESQLNEADDNGSVDISTEIDNNEELKQDSKLAKTVKAIWSVLKKPLKSFAGNKAGDLIDEILLGQFKDAIIKVYKDNKLDKLSDKDTNKELEELQKDSNFKNGEEKSQLDSRKDDNTNAKIDPFSESFYAMWYSKDEENNVGKIINDIVVDIQKAAKQQETDQKKLVAEIKKLNIKSIKDEDIINFGPILKQMIDAKKSPKEIETKLKQLKNQANESYNIILKKFKNSALLSESKFILTENIKNQIMLRALCESEEMQEAVYQQLLSEGFFSALASKIPDKFKQKVKDFGAKTLKVIGNKTLQGILSLGGIAVSVATGGWGAALILRSIYAVENHGKRLRNAFERQYKKFANSRGIVTYMNFSIDGNKNAKYSMRFYSKDMVWRVINTTDQLKMPGKDFVKKIVTGPEGKKYRQRLKEIWDPLFSEAKGGKVDFVALFQQAKDLNIPEKQLQMYKDFAEQYDKILSACVESPKIDTRTQSIIKDKLDK